jgi:nucleotide-binding universal stress UspA family protein
MYDRILIPVDGSDEARRAAARGLEFARAFDATVDVLHIIDRRARRLAKTKTEETRLQERGEAILDDIEAMASERGQSVTTEMTTGVPAVQITERAARTNADLIVVGRQGITGLGKRLLGGVTEGVLFRTNIPVFVVPKGAAAGDSNGYSRLLVPTDGSENAAAAVTHGVEIARKFGSDIHVLNVVALQSAGGPFNAGGLDKAFIERLEADGEADVEGVAATIAETAPEIEVRTAVHRTLSFDGAAAGIREYVTDNDVDAIIIGSHGQSNLRRQLLGSVTSATLHMVDIPVLVIKRDL